MAAEASPSGADAFLPFAESPLWTLPRRSFSERRQQAWLTGEEADDGTHNPLLAAAYAEVLVAFRQERLRRDPEEPALWILELGASSGRFAYHLLRQLAALCERQGLNVRDFRYVLTHVREANLETWLAHPRLQPDLASGQLEMARFDVLAPATLELRPSGERLGPGDLRAPLVVIANSVLDAIPAELLRFREGMVERGLVRLGGLPQGGPAANTAEAELGELEKGGAEASLAPLERLELDFGAEPMAAPAFGDPRLDGLLAGYQRQLAGLEEAWLLFPALTLRTLEWLAALSSQGVLLLAAGEGHHRLEQVLRPQPSGLVWHQGRVSLRGNNHALGGWAAAAGGLALAPLASP
ncbi:MAG: hypothetical protein ACK550_17025, partial [Synechococcaceae cyanobacterium]